MGAAADDPPADEECEMGPSPALPELHHTRQLDVLGIHGVLAVGGLEQARGALPVGGVADHESVEIDVLWFHAWPAWIGL
jgi:hypothetical protein